MKILFWAHDLIEIVLNGNEELGANATKPQRIVHKDLKKNDCNASFLFNKVLMVVTSNLYKISMITNATEAWDILEKYHEGDEKVKHVKLQSLRRKFQLIQMEEDHKIADYISKWSTL